MNLGRIGRRMRPVQPQNSNGAGPPPETAGQILSVQSLTVSFDGFTVLDELDFSMEYGEMRFLIGPNGAGKTTLIDVITGKSKPDSGRIIFDGATDLRRQQEHQLVRLGVGRKFQTPAIFSSLSVYENLELRWDSAPKSPACWVDTDGGTPTGFRPPWNRWGWIAGPKTLPARCPTEKSSGWKSVCCWCRSRNCCCWTNPWPA